MAAVTAPRDRFADSRPGPRRVGLLRASGTVGAMTALSRVSGFARDLVFARTFGADAATDAFFVAFKIPNLFRRLFAEGAFAQAFVPVLSLAEREGRAALRDLIAHVAGALATVLLLLCGLMALAAPLVVLLFAPGYAGDPSRHEPAAAMLRWTAFYLLFVSLVALAGAVQNNQGRFAVPAATPVLLNLVLIAAALGAAPAFSPPVAALAVGVFVAGAVQLAFQLPFLWRLGLLVRPRLDWAHAGMRRVLRLMTPAMFAAAVVQINLMLDTVLASFLAAGAVSWLYYADRLVELPFGVFGLALATASLPALAAKHAAGDAAGFGRNLDWALKSATLISVPAALGLVLLAEPLMLGLFHGGAFTAFDAEQAAWALIAYALGLPAFGYVKILGNAFFARHDSRTPLRAALWAMGGKLLLTAALVLPAIVAAWPRAHAWLASCTALAAWLQAALLLRALRVATGWRAQRGWGRLAAAMAGGLAAMTVVLGWLTPARSVWLEGGLALRLSWLVGLSGAGAAVYFLVLRVGGLRLAHFRGQH